VLELEKKIAGVFKIFRMQGADSKLAKKKRKKRERDGGEMVCNLELTAG